MSHHIKFVKDIGIVGTAQLLTNLRGFVLIPLLTKFLGAEQYGVWAQFSITLNLVAPFIVLSLPNALIRFLPGSKEKKDIQEQVWSTNLFVSILAFFVASLLVVFAPQISGILKIPSELMMLLGILVIFESLGSLLSSVLQALQEAKKLSFYIISTPLAEIIFVSIALLLGYRLYGAILSMVVARGIVFLFLFAWILKKIKAKVPNFSRMREYLQFSLPMVASSIAYRVVQVGDHYLIGLMLGILFVGYYAPAYSFGFMLNMLTLPIGLLLPATLAKFFTEQKFLEIKQYLTETFKYVFFLLIPATFGISIFSRQVLTIFSTKEISDHAYMVLPIIAVSFLFYAAYGIFSQVLYLFKKTAITGILWVGAAIFNVILNLFFISYWGIVGAAFATLFSYFALCVATWLYSARYFSFPFPWISLGKSLLASILMSIILLAFRPENLLTMLFTILCGIALYGAFLFLFKAIGRKEIEFLTKLFA